MSNIQQNTAGPRTQDRNDVAASASADAEITRLVEATAIPKHDGDWDKFADFWANWILSLPADLAAQVVGDLCSFIQVIRYHDREMHRCDDADPGGLTLKEIERLLRLRLWYRQWLQQTSKQKVKRTAA